MTNILVIADSDFAQTTAIKQADKLAKAYDAKLHVVYFYHEDLRGLGSKGEAFRTSILERLEEKANDQLAEVCADNSYTYDVVWAKDISQWVNQYAELYQPFMVVKTGHRSETMFYTSTDWHLIRECPAPVLIVAEDKWKHNPDVLASLDLQTLIPEKLALNHKILTAACEFAKNLNVQVQVCYVPIFSTILRDLGMQKKSDVEDSAALALTPIINELSAQYNIPLENFHIHAGKPELVIPSMAAKHNAGIVVIGTVGRVGIGQKLIGNTAENILGLLKTDVLTLKP